MHRYRSHTCGELRRSDSGQEVRISGWVHNRRNLGGVLFVDLRDNYGLVQLVVRPEMASFQLLESARKETVICVSGKVIERSAANVNKDLPTGEVEVEVTDVEILGTCEPLPFNVFPEEQVNEEKRLTYRFLDVRRSKMHQNIQLRAAVIHSLRTRMVAHGFTEFQTPILSATSPEGARDFLVPSRLNA